MKYLFASHLLHQPFEFASTVAKVFSICSTQLTLHHEAGHKPYHPVDSLGGKLMDEDTSGSQTTR